MSIMTLPNINKRYEDIIHSDLSNDRKSIMLAGLMTEMEQIYKIPSFSNVRMGK